MKLSLKITLLFLVSFGIMLGLGFYLESITKEKNRKLIFHNYILGAKELLPLLVENRKEEIYQKARKLGFKVVGKIEGEEVFKKKILFGKISILQQKEQFFLLLSYLDTSFTFFDTTQSLFKKEFMITRVLVASDVILLTIIYLSVLKLVSPINKLSNSIEEFAKGNYDIKLKPTGGVELEKVANNFNLMAEKIKEGILERENLLRFIGHELKTPLVKANFALEKRDLKTLKKVLEEIRYLTQRILELHTISITNLNFTYISSDTLLLEALQRCHIPQEELIRLESETFTLKGDRELLAIALKNLIENALKYSSSFPIQIVAKEGSVKIINYGEKISPLAKSNKSFGLLIVKNILQKHNFPLHYSHCEGKNIFTILLKPPNSRL